jgi:hypothetical protein
LIGLFVREANEVACFQHVTEILNGLVSSYEFSIVRAVLLLRWVELLGEECKGLLGVVDALLW